MRKFAIVNHKGGPGKTTTTVNLAGALCDMKFTVLIIDVDSAAASICSASFSVIVPESTFF